MYYPVREFIYISLFPHSEQFLQDFSILFCKIRDFMVAKHLPDIAGGGRWLLARLLCVCYAVTAVISIKQEWEWGSSDLFSTRFPSTELWLTEPWAAQLLVLRPGFE